MKESPLFWPARLDGKILLVLDETLLPQKMHYIKIKNVAEAVKIIRDMKTRAFGQFLVVLNTFLLVLLTENKCWREEGLLEQIKTAAQALNNSRPTFPFSEVTSMVVGWVQKAFDEDRDIRSFVTRNILGYLAGIRVRRLERVKQIAAVIQNGDKVLTHCNVSGELAMAAHLCKTQKKKVKFFATETRPYFQGSKLTCWELKKAGADVTLVADNAVGYLLKNNIIDRIIVGSDRSCANGDIANKIGTYQIAVLAKEFGVPLYALTQPSNKTKTGKDIPIEIRNENELLNFEGKRIAPKCVRGFYPGFDVIPHELITKPIALNVN